MEIKKLKSASSLMNKLEKMLKNFEKNIIEKTREDERTPIIKSHLIAEYTKVSEALEELKRDCNLFEMIPTKTRLPYEKLSGGSITDSQILHSDVDGYSLPEKPNYIVSKEENIFFNKKKDIIISEKILKIIGIGINIFPLTGSLFPPSN